MDGSGTPQNGNLQVIVVCMPSVNFACITFWVSLLTQFSGIQPLSRRSYCKIKLKFSFQYAMISRQCARDVMYDEQVFRIMKPLRLVKLFRLLKVSTVYR